MHGCPKSGSLFTPIANSVGMPIAPFYWKLCLCIRARLPKEFSENGEKFCFFRGLQMNDISAGIARCFCLPIRRSFHAICVRVLPCRRTTLSLVHFLFQNLATFPFLLRKFVTRTFSCAFQRDSRSICIRVEYNSSIHLIKKRRWFQQINVVHLHFQKIGSTFSFYPANLMSYTYTEKSLLMNRQDWSFVPSILQHDVLELFHP